LIVYLVGCFIEYLKIHGSTNPKNWQWIYTFQRVGKMYGPMRWSPAIPAQGFTANCSWWCGLSTVWNFICQNVTI
jgi:hypothetical protein